MKKSFVCQVIVWSLLFVGLVLSRSGLVLAQKEPAEKHRFDPVIKDIEGRTVHVDPKMLGGEPSEVNGRALKMLASPLDVSGCAAPVLGKGPVQVFILAGQSNMEGKAAAYTLEAAINDPKTRAKFGHLKPGGKWLVRDDVFVTYLGRQSRGKSRFPRHGPLTVGFGSPKQGRDENNRRMEVASIGPELGIGQVLGEELEEPVLLIKAAWGGLAVKYRFRPPSAMPDDAEIRAQVAAVKAKKPEAEASFESFKAGYGSGYRKILSETKRVLEEIAMYVPDYDETEGYEIAGFVWFQGWNDGVGAGNPEYEEQMAHFIRDMRRDLKVPTLPFVIGELGTDGPEAEGWIETFRKQQAAIAEREEFQGNVLLARTAEFWPTGQPDLSKEWAEFRALAKANEEKAKDDPSRVNPGEFFHRNWNLKYKKQLSYTSDKRYHYLGSGACYYQMGESMGKAMRELLKGKGR